MVIKWLVLLLLIVSVSVIEAVVTCREDQVFCVVTGQCIDRQSVCTQHKVIGGCQQDEVFCLRTGKCIKIEKSCSRETHNCNEDEIFCLKSEKCIPKNVNKCNDDAETPQKCEVGAVKCLHTGNCLQPSCQNNGHSNVQCPENKVFCMKKGECVELLEHCEDFTSKCPEGQTRCLQTGHCVSKTTSCEGTDGICPEGEIKCLQTGRCVKKKMCDRTITQPTTCPSDKILCLSTSKCIDKAPACSRETKTDDAMSSRCKDGQIKCLKTGKCIDKYPGCHVAQEDTCQRDEVWCLQTGSCIQINNKCNVTTPIDTSMKCSQGQVMCLRTGKCIAKQDYCSREKRYNMRQQCPPGQTLCLHTGKCVPTSYNCHRSDATASKCLPGHVMCLQTGNCVPIREGCINRNIQPQTCPDGYSVCLKTGVCTIRTNNCLESNRNTSSITCPTGYIMCLRIGQCIPSVNATSSICSESKPNSSIYCPAGYVMCLKNGKCISVRDKQCHPHDNSTTAKTNCPVGQVMCLKTGKCISVHDNQCHHQDNRTTMITNCPSSHVMCLKTGKCISVHDNQCHHQDNRTTMITNCPSSHVMCLKTGKCVSTQDNMCNLQDTTNIEKCPSGHVICLKTDKCVSVQENNCNHPDNNTTLLTQCPAGHSMCLKSGKCISMQDNLCYRRNSSTTMITKCPAAHVMCLKTRKCISIQENHCHLRNNRTQLTTIHVCPTGQVMCLRQSTCIPKGCTSNATIVWNDWNTTTDSMETSTSGETSTIMTSPSIREINILLPEPLFPNEDYLFVTSEVTDYNIGPVVDLFCGDNVQLKSMVNRLKGGFIVGNNITQVLITRGLFLSLLTGGDGVCTMITETLPSMVFILTVKIITELVPPTVTFSRDISYIEEDTTYVYFQNMKDWYNITLNEPNIDISSFNLSDDRKQHFHNKHHEKLLKHHQDMRTTVTLMLRHVPINKYGVPVVLLETHDGTKWIPRVETHPVVDIVRSVYRIKFTEMCNCNFTLELQQTGQPGDSMNFMVLPVNDSPELTNRAVLRYSSLVEHTLLYPYQHTITEFIIKDFINHFYMDEDADDTLGIAVIGQLSDRIGTWKYHTNNAWEPFPLVNPRDGNVTVHLFNLNDTLRFTPANSTYLWSRHEAIAYTQLFVLAWDGYHSNSFTTTEQIPLHSCSGIHHKICGPGGSSHFSKEIITLYINRVGCDNTPSSLMEADSCGVCGGHDDCIDCTGTPHGGATFDMCGDCTGGSSGLVYGHNQDCNHQCGENYYEERLQMCIRNGTDVKGLLTLLSCDSVLKSGAYINKCGYCVLGNTSFPENHGEDVCGDCHGDGTSCVDCANVVNGNKSLDFCGQCLEPSDSNFNKDCIKLVAVSPVFLPNFGSHELQAVGVHLDVFTSVDCSLEGLNSISLNTTHYHSADSKVVMVTEDLSGHSPGIYNVSCVFVGTTTETLQYAGVEIFEYPQVTDVSPSSMNLGQHVKVNITTSSLTDTGYIECVLLCPFIQPDIGCFSARSVSLMRFPTLMLDSHTVHCDLSRLGYLNHARNYNLSVIMEERGNVHHSRLSSIEFIVRAEAPIIQSARFDRSFCYFSLIFDTEITGPRICKNIFQRDTLSLLGTDPFCVIVGRRILIDLDKDNSLQPGDTITLRQDSIYRFGSVILYASFASGNVIINTPTNAMHPEFSLSGPSIAGSCEEFMIVLHQKSSGCMKFTNKWSIQGTTVLSSFNNSTEFTDLVSRIESLHSNTRMITIQHNEIPPGESVNFVVTVEDSFNNRSHILTHNVSREVDLNPVSVFVVLLGDSRHVDPADIVRFRAKTKLAECYNATEGKIRLSWQSDTTDFSVSIFNDKPIAAIRPNTLRGGSVYTLTVNAFLDEDPNIAATDIVTFHTISKPLLVSIRGGDHLVFSTEQEVILDASVSKDPDRQNLRAFHSWTCKYESGFPCFLLIGNETVLMSTVFPLNDRVTIPASTVHLGERLLWTVTMKVGERSGSFTTTVEIVNVLPPVLDIQQTNIIVNPHGVLRIPCSITSHVPVMVTWSSVSESGYDTLDLTTVTSQDSLVKETQTAVSNLDFSLYIDLSGETSLPAGAKFIFAVTAFGLENGQSSEQKVHIIVNSAPTIGDVMITPSNGTSLTTEFTIDIGNGWTDIDGDSTVLFFYVKTENQEKMRLNARGLSDVYTYKFKLTEGVYDVIVEICDTSKACSHVTMSSAVTVTSRNFTAADLDQAAASITKALQTDINQALGMALTFSDLLSTDSNETSSVVLVVNDVAENLLTSVVASYDPSDATSVLDSANAMLQKLADSGAMKDTVRSESQSLAFDLASMVTQSTDPSRRRRKRSTTATVSPLSVDDARIILTTYSSTFSGQSTDSINTLSANQFLEALDNIFKGVCATVSYAEEAVIIFSALTTLSINKRVVEGTAHTVYDVSCTNCTHVTHPGKVTYGMSVQSKYTHWNCSDYLSCYGACFATAQLTMDIITPTSPTAMSLTNRVRRSDIMVLRIVNPAENTVVDAGMLSSPIALSIPIYGDVNMTSYSLQCLHWDGGNWVDTDCNTDTPSIITPVYTAVCSCFKLGYVAVFEGAIITDELDSTTLDTVSTEQNTFQSTEPDPEPNPGALDTFVTQVTVSTEHMTYSSTEPNPEPEPKTTTMKVITVPGSAEAVLMSFIMDADYHYVIRNDMATFVYKVKQRLARTMGVDVSRITYVSITSGSIVVTFKLEAGSGKDPSLESSVQTLQSAILSGNLVITDFSGSALPIIKTSFTYETTSKESTPDNENQSTLFIILGCVGGLLIIAIVVIALLVHKMKKNNTAIASSPPPPYGPQMHGVDVPIPAGGGNRQLVVKERESNKQPDIKIMTESGKGSSMKDIEVIAVDKGGYQESGISGQIGGIKTSHYPSHWNESELRPRNSRDSGRQVPGPAEYMPPIS